MDRSSLPRDILRSLGEDLDEESKKERDIITSNRVKLTEYIHDVTLLFPYMKEKGVFTVGDCDLVRAEPTGTLKVDKFVDIFLTKWKRNGDLVNVHCIITPHWLAVGILLFSTLAPRIAYLLKINCMPFKYLMHYTRNCINLE